MKPAPYISFIATSRNDDHGGDMRKRMTIFVNGLIHQCNRYQLPCELVMVDWNSPDQDQLLDTVLPKPGPEDFLKIRYIVVPPKYHEALRFSETMGLYQMIAKNVGIRRAKGEFIACTNVDLLFSDGLFERMQKRDLKKGIFYRANRCDIPNTIDENTSTEEQLKFASENILKTLGKDPRYPIFQEVDGRFISKWIFGPFKPALALLKKGLLSKEHRITFALDFDACGDFTMMSKEDWEKIDGYAELEMYSLHIDSMALFEAAAKGIQQEVLPAKACTYHIAHTGGWEFADPIEKIQFFAKWPTLEWWSVWVAGNKIVREKSTFGINRENWGLNDQELREIEG